MLSGLSVTCAFGSQCDLCFQGLSVIGVQQIDRVVEVVEEALKGKLFVFLEDHSFKFEDYMLEVVSLWNCSWEEAVFVIVCLSLYMEKTSVVVCVSSAS